MQFRKTHYCQCPDPMQCMPHSAVPQVRDVQVLNSFHYVLQCYSPAYMASEHPGGLVVWIRPHSGPGSYAGCCRLVAGAPSTLVKKRRKSGLKSSQNLSGVMYDGFRERSGRQIASDTINPMGSLTHNRSYQGRAGERSKAHLNSY